MKYLTLIIVLLLLVFVGSDWYNAPIGPQIFVMVALLVSGVIVLNSLVNDRKSA